MEDKSDPLLEISTPSTKMSFREPGSGSSSSSAHSNSSNDVLIRQYEAFIQHQDPSFIEEVESLVAQRRASTAANKIHLRDEFQAGDPACDHFVIVGCDQNRDPPQPDSTQQQSPPPTDRKKRTEADYKHFLEDPAVYHPKVLFHYPPEAPLEQDVPGLTHYCFPSGAIPQKFIRKKSAREKTKSAKFSFTRMASLAPPPAAPNQSDIALSPVAQALALDSIVGVNPEFFCFPGSLGSLGPSKHAKNVLSYHCEAENSYVFVFTSEDTIKYGVCVYKEVIAYQTEEFYCVEPLCFCVITSVPFVNFFVDSIVSILDFPRVNDLAMIQKDHFDVIIKNATQMFKSKSTKKEQESEPNNDDNNDNNDSNDDNDDDEKDPVMMDYSRVVCATMELCDLKIPPLGKPLEYFPATRTIGFEVMRPQFEEECQLLQDFGGALLFNVLPASTITQLIAALLLEFKVVIVSPSKRLLSSVILSLIPLIKPFVYGAPVLPVLPLVLLKYFETPGPALVGLTREPFVQSTEGFFVVNLNTGAIQCTKPLPNLPDNSKLIKRIEEITKKAGIPSVPSKGIGFDIPSKFFSNPASQGVIEGISETFLGYFAGLFEDFQIHCLSNVTSDSSTTTIFMEDSFVESQPPDRKPFIELFVKTGIFKEFENRKLCKIDFDKTEFRKSLRSRRFGTLGRDRKKKTRTLK